MRARLLILGLAMAVLAVTASAAGAANPMPGQTYEGPGPKGGSDVILVVSKNGARVQRLSVGYDRGCRMNGKPLKQQSTLYAQKVRIRNGRFHWGRTIHYKSTGAVFTQSVKGRFVDSGARFVGTARETLRNPVTHVRCDSGTVKFDGSVAERVLVNGQWAGTTSQGRPLTLTITKDGVTAMTFDVTLTCTNGEQLVRSFGALDEPADVSDYDLTFRAGRRTVDTDIGVEGTAQRSLVKGTITATDAVTHTDAQGDERTYSCSSGDVTFEAKRP